MCVCAGGGVSQGGIKCVDLGILDYVSYDGVDDADDGVRGWFPGSARAWLQKNNVAPWTWALRQARLRHWSVTLKGDRLQPARRVLVDAQGRAYTHRANPAPSSGGHQRPPWLYQVCQEHEPETEPAQAGGLTDRLNKLQAITAQAI